MQWCMSQTYQRLFSQIKLMLSSLHVLRMFFNQSNQHRLVFSKTFIEAFLEIFCSLSVSKYSCAILGKFCCGRLLFHKNSMDETSKPYAFVVRLKPQLWFLINSSGSVGSRSCAFLACKAAAPVVSPVGSVTASLHKSNWKLPGDLLWGSLVLLVNALKAINPVTLFTAVIHFHVFLMKQLMDYKTNK